MKPQFAELSFPTEKKFNAWLNQTTNYKVNLHDFGQDMLTIYIHESGEILHSDFHSKIYTGRFVEISSIEKDNALVISNESGEFHKYHRLVVDSVELPKLKTTQP